MEKAELMVRQLIRKGRKERGKTEEEMIVQGR